MKPAEPLDKIGMIEGSLRCFAFGLPGLLPVIGIPMAILALSEYRRVRRGGGEQWNPADRYLFWGGVCARMGLSLFLLIPLVVLIMARLCNPI